MAVLADALEWPDQAVAGGQPGRRRGEDDEPDGRGEGAAERGDGRAQVLAVRVEPEQEERAEQRCDVPLVHVVERVLEGAGRAVVEPALQAHAGHPAEADDLVDVDLRPVERVRVDAVRGRPRPLVDEHGERERREVADVVEPAPVDERGGQQDEEPAVGRRQERRRARAATPRRGTPLPRAPPAGSIARLGSSSGRAMTASANCDVPTAVGIVRPWASGRR